MGILKSWFTAKPRAEEPSYEIVERRLSIDESRYQSPGQERRREFYAEELFQDGENPRGSQFRPVFSAG